jgi:hypothetical protein
MTNNIRSEEQQDSLKAVTSHRLCIHDDYYDDENDEWEEDISRHKLILSSSSQHLASPAMTATAGSRSNNHSDRLLRRLPPLLGDMNIAYHNSNNSLKQDSLFLLGAGGKPNAADNDASTCCSTTCMEDSLASLKCTLYKPATTTAMEGQESVWKKAGVLARAIVQQERHPLSRVMASRRLPQDRLVALSRKNTIKPVSMHIKSLPRELEIADYGVEV